mmetsp:Transcript_6239/g.11092  ORF Transcript_6239/g.11092 Transcript_6239/m.11092 type:complete len:229 (-) Transcript_6239:93-779(-)|eukprot:CAMPEP_0184528280 /NCGR_PEP_ID=MMETSP0198_2-20121128/11705_1 /TAXON_ID=1112570 /ORGANISM="Thraustochytrium sp., Strain LLF1b" /LENGTH=228 /DNA_ID=CAMNT_0026920111 /DNA_START=91 /DNA_END=777 /DNA_ORIENTATION=+
MELTLVPKTIKPMGMKTGLKVFNDLKARDKILRFAQYYLKFLVYRLKTADEKSDAAKRLNLLAKGLSLHRKAFKLGTFMDEIDKLQDLLKSGKSGVKESLSILLRSIMTLFIITDNMVYFASLKVADWDKDALKSKAYKLRLSAAVLQTCIGYLDIEKQAKTIKAASGEERETAKEKQGQLAVTMLKNVLDIVTYANSAKYIEVNDGNIGLVGAASAGAALYTIWCKK